MPKKVMAFKCRWCDAVMLDEEQARQAEASCPHNPGLECCENCAHLQLATTPRYQSIPYPVKVCAKPPESDLVFEPPHNLGWCPNYQRNPLMEGKNGIS